MNALPQIKDPVIKTQRAIEAAGSKSRLARVLGLSRASIQYWGECVPLTQVYRVAQAFPFLLDKDD